VTGDRAKAIPQRIAILQPLRRAPFRRLWLSMSASYAGDRLQQLAQGWLVATLTDSALAVGAITMLGSLPLLLSPLGGVVADQVDRRRILFFGQLAGAAATAAVAGLILAGRIAIGYIYVWALLNGLIVLFSRPSYKVAITESVPVEEVRSAVAINSMGETLAMVGVNAGGSVILAFAGLPVAFVVNAVTYLVAAASVWSLQTLGQGRRVGQLDASQWLSDLREGAVYLYRKPELAGPLLLTFLTIVAVTPGMGLLPAIVHAQEGSIIDLGLLAGMVSVGAFLGAAYAGARGAGARPLRRYAALGLVGAAALALFAALPVGWASLPSLGLLGFLAFAQAVWNTSRVRREADPAYQARLQSFTSMAFTLGSAVGALWGGCAIDRLGIGGLYVGAGALAAISIGAALVDRGRDRSVTRLRGRRKDV
jgi:predicted MFS family arabinose efflux permease